MKKPKRVITAKELIRILENTRVRLDCGHHHTQHRLSNTMVVTAEGKAMCHECYFSGGFHGNTIIDYLHRER